VETVYLAILVITFVALAAGSLLVLRRLFSDER
jgi:hypothetical protein